MLSKKPRPLAEGVGEGSQHPHEIPRTETKPSAKYNKDEKNPPAGGFFLLLMRRLRTARGEGAKTTHEGWFYSFQNGGGAPPF